MQVVKDNKSFGPSWKRLLKFFSRGDLHFSTNAHLCFVCGAADPEPGKPPSLRRRFLDYVASKERNLVCVLAEHAVTDLLRQVDERRLSKDVAVIEQAIAATVDSLLLFPESPGSIAELGFFSAREDVASRMLVALEHKYQGDSFITLGPVKRVNDMSAFRPLPMTIAEDVEASFEQICVRLLGEQRRAKSYGVRFSAKEWKLYSLREQLSIVDKIMDLTGILTESDLLDFISERFGSYEVSDVRLQLALLATMGRVARNDMGDVIRIYGKSKTQFVEGGSSDAIDVRASWSDAYAEHLPEANHELSDNNPDLSLSDEDGEGVGLGSGRESEDAVGQ